MDFPVCPACHQSVIDDDAVDCPFCGASMKGKPGAKPPAKIDSKIPVTSAPGANKPASSGAKSPSGARTPDGKPGPAKPGTPGDDFPFDIELTSGKAAIPAMPNPTKQRSWKVVCPMCDTPGYLPASAAGQDVRCANMKCVMPVFTAPLPEKKEAAAPPPRKSNSVLWVLLGLVIVAVFGGGLGYLVYSPSGKKEMSDEDRKLMQELAKGSNKPGVNDLKNLPVANDPNAGQKEKEKGIDIEALIDDVLKRMEASCQDEKTDKAFCRQLTAEANAVCGRLDAASNNLDRLVAVGRQTLSYYRILPLLEIFWSTFKAGDKDKANKALEMALVEAPKIPVYGQVRFEIVGRLAAALAAAGRIADAAEQLAKVQSDVPKLEDCLSQPSQFLRRPPISFAEPFAQSAARLQIATDGHVASLSDTHSVLPWKFPQSVAVTAALYNRDLSKAALEWAASQSDLEAKTECLAYWAEEVARRNASEGTVDPDGSIAEATKVLPPVLAARVWARVGCGRLRKKDFAGVAEALKLAQMQLDQVGPPAAALKLPTDVKSINKFKLPQSVQLSLQAATAAAEIAFLQAQAKESIDAAEKTVDLALDFVDTTAPSLTAIKKIYDETKSYDEETGSFDLTKLRAYVKAESKGKLKKEDDIKKEASLYKQKITDSRIAAQQRFEFQRLLLSRLRGAGLGLNSKVWIIVNSRARAEDISKKDDFFLNPLPGELVEGLKGKDEANAVLGAWTMKFNEPAPARPVPVEFNERLMKDDAVGAVKFLEASGLTPSQRDEIFIETACRLADAKKLKTTFDFIQQISRESVREDCYRLASAIATKRDLLNDVWAEVKKVTQHTDKIAICRGLIAGLRTPEN